MSIGSFFSSSCETRELHKEVALRTNYYRNRYKEVIEALRTLADENDLDVKIVDNDHKEVYMLGKGHEVIVTITQVSPIEAGIDFKVNFFSTIGFNRPINKVKSFYQQLKNSLNFKGVSLHP